MDLTHLHAANTEMENQSSTSNQTAGANLPDQTLGAPQANVSTFTAGLIVGGDIVARDVSINISSSGSPTKKTKRSHSFRFNIPLPTKHFKGREDILKDIRDFFEKVPADTSDFCDRIVVIAGCGGMGKTETAYKAAAVFEDLFPSVAWINAEKEDSLLKSFLGLAKKLGVASKDLKIADMDADLVKEVYEHIDQNDYGNVLFIFDNAIRFNSSGDEFGIYSYLPTETLINKRYPYILITTQTHEWGKQTKVLQVDTLSEENSLEFFRSSFRVNSMEYNEEFERLHKVTEGYPLVMNLAASNIDYNRRPSDDSVRELRQKIHDYIADLAKESGKILTEEMKHWPTSYTKTLSAAWQLTFQRLEQEDNGREALKVLQICSFLELPIYSNNVVDILTLRTACPHPVNTELQLRDLLYLLERFYAARILEVHKDHAHGFDCDLGIHRLVQLAVREQTNCSQVLQVIIGWRVLRFTNSWGAYLNTSSLHDAMKRTHLPQVALASVGLLACLGDPIASDIVQTRKPETKAAEVAWRLYKMKAEIRTSDGSAVQLLTEVIELWKSAEVPGDRRMYFTIAISILNDDVKMFQYVIEDGTRVENFSHLKRFRGIENLACELISEYPAFCECRCGLCEWIDRIKGCFYLVGNLLIKQIEEFVHADVQQSESMRTQVTHAFLNIIPLFKLNLCWRDTWDEIKELVGVSQSRMAELRTSLWDHGLAQKLEDALQCYQHSKNTVHERFTLGRCVCKLESVQNIQGTFILLLSLFLDFCLDGMDSTDERVQQVIIAFTEMTARVLARIDGDKLNDILILIFRGPIRFHFICEVCSVWILLLLMSEPSEYLLELLSRCEALTWLEGDRLDSLRLNLKSSEFWRSSEYFRKDLKPKVSQYIQKYSSSKVKRVQTLITFCRLILSSKEEESSSESEWPDEPAEASSSKNSKQC